MDKQTFHATHSNSYFLESNIRSISDYLSQQKYLLTNEQISNVEVAGEGNMNCTLRVFSNQRTFIIKQSRPWVEKFPNIAAPVERALMEGEFYQNINNNKDLTSNMPCLLHMDKKSYILIFEDLGNAQDFSYIYNNKLISSEHVEQLTLFLAKLHNTKSKTIENTDMRKLNYEHIYVIPFQNNFINLDEITPGLNNVACDFRTKQDYKHQLQLLGKLYLENGKTLLHGDYYPGSWLMTDNGVKIIDAEFCFSGPCEFDMGVMIAHLLLAKQPRSFVYKIFAHYKKINSFDVKLAFRFAGVEIMRRLLGVAQLPLKYSLQDKHKLLELSYRLVITPDNTLSETD
ncbi:phosphotransferase [Candidatus Uabimicrobium sp. HlEnr_7]|uniref:phosphotransferase n=1 Tax=Candidatus Uabimicrobium helgolandensis TaxID=3095367 RepID=UPI00355917D1